MLSNNNSPAQSSNVINVWMIVTSYPGHNPPGVDLVDPQKLSSDIQAKLIAGHGQCWFDMLDDETDDPLAEHLLPFKYEEGIAPNYKVTRVLTYYIG